MRYRRFKEDIKVNKTERKVTRLIPERGNFKELEQVGRLGKEGDMVRSQGRSCVRRKVWASFNIGWFYWMSRRRSLDRSRHICRCSIFCKYGWGV